MVDDLQFELLTTYQEKKKLYDDKIWELIHDLLKSKPYKNKSEKLEFLKKLVGFIILQDKTMHQAYQMICDAGHNISYNTLASLIMQEDKNRNV